jgi:hypothetical protein
VAGNRNLKEIVQNGNDTSIVVDPRPDLHRTLSRIRVDFGDSPGITILGIARLDLADASGYRALLAALDDRWAGDWFDMPFKEF